MSEKIDALAWRIEGTQVSDGDYTEDERALFLDGMMKGAGL